MFVCHVFVSAGRVRVYLCCVCMSAGRVRVLLRREQVLKVACNHNLTTDMTLQPMLTSETAWCWSALDYVDGEGQYEQFAVKFKVSGGSHNYGNII